MVRMGLPGWPSRYGMGEERAELRRGKTAIFTYKNSVLTNEYDGV